jgi:hypothetical protein
MFRMCVLCILALSKIPQSILRQWTPHFWGGSVIVGIRARSGLNTLRPYKDYSSLIRWQDNMCSYIATTELWWQRYVVVFGECFNLFYCWWTYFVVCGFSRDIKDVNASFIVYQDFSCLWVACRRWVGMKVLVCYRHEWRSECWSCKGLCEGWWLIDPFSACTLTCAKTIETCVESVFVTKCVWSAIKGSFFYFGEDD